MTETTAGVEGPDWTAKAELWAELWAHFADPARVVLCDATAVGPGTRLLDVGCGSGELCALAAERGASVAGIDAAEGMIEIARRRLPEADLRVGPMEALPWADGSFDVVCGVNSFQFAADYARALREAARVARPGGLVGICTWGGRRDVCGVLESLRALLPPEPPGPARPRYGEPGVLERLAREAGMEPRQSGDVDVPYEVPDQATLERALLIDEEMREAVARVGEEHARRVVEDATASHRRADGSYRFENRFRYVVAAVP